VRIDAAQLRQLVLNLVGNAVDATRDSGGEVRISTTPRLVDDDDARGHGAPRGGHFLRLSVTDDGAGMDAATLARAFDPFFTSKGEGRGTGIGLPLCQSVAARAGGFIRAHSTAGQGSEFQVYLPLETNQATQRASQPPQRQSAIPAPGSDAGRPLLLVVEDIAAVRELLVTLMSGLDVEVRAVSTCGAAAQVIASEPVDVLLTDGRLPDGSGVVLARSARATRPQIRTILVSGTLDDASEFDASVGKPFDPEVLKQTVVSLLPVTD
jgi:CheY-like chemotaxis protein